MIEFVLPKKKKYPPVNLIFEGKHEDDLIESIINDINIEGEEHDVIESIINDINNLKINELTNINNSEDLDEDRRLFINIIKETYNLYIKDGPRSNSNVNHFHNYIKYELLKIIYDKPNYSVKLEHNVESTNSSGKKKCDIVMLKDNVPYIIFPVKITKSNYKQNKNNSWENLTGELQHLKWANDNLKLIPINIFINKTPYLNNKKKINKFENVTFCDINNYDILIQKNIAYDIINYIMLVEHNNNVNDNFDKIPNILGFDNETPYRKLSDILRELL
jgi:hypothetical protein